MPKWLKWVLISVAAVAVLIVGGTWFYIHVIEGPAPAKLSFAGRDASSSSAATTGPASPAPTSTGGAPSSSAAGTSAPGSSAPVTAAPASAGFAGTWSATSDSQAGYRVKENLFGQNTEAVGRTNAITGDLVIDQTGVQSCSFSVDLTQVSSDQSQRDNQFKGRIMNVSTFPTADFRLTSPIAITAVPADKEEMTFKATGDLTLRGTTKSVTFDLTARRNGPNIEVNGNIPLVFADYGIPNPSAGPATTEDNGLLEFLLVFSKAA
jgi:polyisoprenoid-binding protein YceI